MKLEIRPSNQFKKDVKLAKRRGLDLNLLINTIDKLANREILESKYNDNNQLTGNYSGFRECHIQPDWLLVYKVIDEKLVLVVFRTGSHSDLF
jgi:mRNA interferase YafQ